MKKNIYKLCHILLFLLLSTSNKTIFSWNQRITYSFDKIIYVGNIVFPQTVQVIPQISLYRQGVKIKSETDHTSKKIQFTISDDKDRKTIYLLITQEVHPHIKDNTIQFLKINNKQSYKLYKMELVNTKKTINTLQTINTQKNKKSYEWIISEEKIAENGKIPDDALIIIFNPDFVQNLKGGTELELPKIIIKQNILEIAGGSEEKLHEEEVILLMSSLDLNLIHSKITPQIQQKPSKKLVIAISDQEK